MRSNRIAGLDVARACAMLYIVGYYHMVSYSQGAMNHLPFAHNLVAGFLGVFCFCSGYLCSRSLQNRPERSLWSFMARRILRLYPPYVAAIVLGMATGWFYWPQLVPSLLLLNPILDISIWTLWFIPLIMWLDCVAYGISQIRARRLGYAAATCLWGVLLIVELQTDLLDQRLVTLYPALLLGFFAARSDKASTLLGKGWPTVCAAVISFGLVVAPNNWGGSIGSLLHATAIVTSLALAITSMCFWITRWLGGRFWLLLSYASYFAYLIHRTALTTAVRLYDMSELRLNLMVYLYAICLPIVLLLAYGLQWLYSMVVKKLQAYLEKRGRFASSTD